MRSDKFRPMLAAEVGNLSDLHFPVLATDKIDGIRVLTHNLPRSETASCVPLTRANKQIPNTYLHGKLSKLPTFLDGELTAGKSDAPPPSYHTSQSQIMSQEGFPECRYYLFDYFENQKMAYSKRVDMLRRWAPTLPEWCEILHVTEIHNLDQLFDHLKKRVAAGFEGLVVRPWFSEYKQGRATPKQQWMVKIKLFEDSEARIIGYKELMRNRNAPTVSATGYQVRSSHQANMEAGGTLGALICKDIYDEREFRVGTGFSAELRDTIWHNQDAFLGQVIKYKYQVHGQKDLPRIPSFLGFRDRDDM